MDLDDDGFVGGSANSSRATQQALGRFDKNYGSVNCLIQVLQALFLYFQNEGRFNVFLSQAHNFLKKQNSWKIEYLKASEFWFV